MRFPVLNLFGTRYEDRNKGGQDKALGPSGYRVGLRSQSSSQALAGEAWWELRSRPVLEKEGERRGRKVEVVELDLERLQGDWE